MEFICNEGNNRVLQSYIEINWKKCNFRASCWELNLRPCESSKMLCQLSYEDCC